jgi:hypothetical protein
MIVMPGQVPTLGTMTFAGPVQVYDLQNHLYMLKFPVLVRSGMQAALHRLPQPFLCPAHTLDTFVLSLRAFYSASKTYYRKHPTHVLTSHMVVIVYARYPRHVNRAERTAGSGSRDLNSLLR